MSVRLKEITKMEEERICDFCKRNFETPIQESERIKIDNLDFHKRCLKEIIKNQMK